jgi:hypothetical protein
MVIDIKQETRQFNRNRIENKSLNKNGLFCLFHYGELWLAKGGGLTQFANQLA